MRQVVARITMLAGAPLGGALVALGGLRAALLFDAATFALMLAILLFIRVPNWTKEPSNQRMLREIRDGLRLVGREPLLRATLILVGVAAGVLLPVMSLVVPLLAHSARWNAQSTGLVVGTFSAASVAVAFVAMWRGVPARVGMFSALGLLVAGAGVGLLAVSSWVVPAILAAAVIGVGNGLFSTCVGPLVLRSPPPEFTSRIHAITLFVQTVPLLVTNNALGWWADRAGATQITVICALLTVAAGIYGFLSPALRRAVFT
jgi:MFS family permease